MRALLELKGIRREYVVGGEPLTVLKGVDLSIAEGEFVAIMGPSGSGKSTLMQILGLLDRPSAGTYLFDGRDVSTLSDDEGAALRSRAIGFIFQMFNLLPRTSALANVALPLVYAGAEDRDARARELLAVVGLDSREDHHPNQLSGGQQQRVAIARALVNRPRVVFADEPTGNLASDQAEEILAKLGELNRSGITVIMVTHEPDIASHAERVIRIKDGLIVSDERKGTAPPPSPLPLPPAGEGKQDGKGRSRREESFWLALTEARESLFSALRAMGANKVRSGLSALGILIGVASVIAMLAIGKGAQKAVESRISSMGSNLVIVRSARSNVGGVRSAAGASSRLTPDDMAAIAKASPRILRVDGNVGGQVQVVYGAKNTATDLTGATPNYEAMRAATPYHGRFFTESEDAERARVAVLGQTVVTELFGDEDPVGKTIKVNRVNFTVVGVLPLKGSGGMRDQDDVVLIPLQTAMRRTLGAKYLSSIAVECDGPDGIAEAMADITAMMRRRRGLGPGKEDTFELRNMAELQAALSGTTQVFTMLLGTVAAISMLVGGIGIMNIMLVSVSERTREIGLRKAIGATRRAILSQFLIEACAISTLGGLAGIALGASVAFLMSAFAGWATVVTPASVAGSFFFSAGVGMLFGWWPARKASLLSPIEALRYE